MRESASDDMYKRVFNSVSEGILIVDAKGVIIQANPKLFELFGFGEELVGQPLHVLIPDRFHGSHVKHHGNYMKRPEQRSMGKGMSLWAMLPWSAVFINKLVKLFK